MAVVEVEDEDELLFVLFHGGADDVNLFPFGIQRIVVNDIDFLMIISLQKQ